MTLEERKKLAYKILNEMDEVKVAPGAEQLKLDMEALMIDIIEKDLEGSTK